MQHADARAEQRGETPGRLRSQGDLRHEHDRAAAAAAHAIDQPRVDERLARTSHAVQQCDPAAAARERIDPFDSAALLVRRRERRRARVRRAGRTAFLFFYSDDAGTRGARDRLRGRTCPAARLGKRQAPAVLGQRRCQPLLDGALDRRGIHEHRRRRPRRRSRGFSPLLRGTRDDSSAGQGRQFRPDADRARAQPCARRRTRGRERAERLVAERLVECGAQSVTCLRGLHERIRRAVRAGQRARRDRAKRFAKRTCVAPAQPRRQLRPPRRRNAPPYRPPRRSA